VSPVVRLCVLFREGAGYYTEDKPHPHLTVTAFLKRTPLRRLTAACAFLIFFIWARRMAGVGFSTQMDV
jgi:hypothetical protein